MAGRSTRRRGEISPVIARITAMPSGNADQAPFSREKNREPRLHRPPKQAQSKDCAGSQADFTKQAENLQTT